MDTEVLQCITAIVPRIERFMEDRPELSPSWMQDFGRWLMSNETQAERSGDVDPPLMDALIGMHLVDIANRLRSRMNRFVSSSPFSTFMDYQFLYVVREHEDMTKSQLIAANSMEMSSGIEVVKRLLGRGWISETSNPKDRRSKLIAITESGSQLVADHAESAASIYNSFSRDLSVDEKIRVLETLSLLVEDGSESPSHPETR